MFCGWLFDSTMQFMMLLYQLMRQEWWIIGLVLKMTCSFPRMLTLNTKQIQTSLSLLW